MSRKVDAFDDPQSQTAAGCVGDPAEQIAFETRRQELAVRRRRDRRANDQDTFRAFLGVNRSFELDRLAGKQRGVERSCSSPDERIFYVGRRQPLAVL